jgi:hypothetical protein
MRRNTRPDHAGTAAQVERNTHIRQRLSVLDGNSWELLWGQAYEASPAASRAALDWSRARRAAALPDAGRRSAANGTQAVPEVASDLSSVHARPLEPEMRCDAQGWRRVMEAHVAPHAGLREPAIEVRLRVASSRFATARRDEVLARLRAGLLALRGHDDGAKRWTSRLSPRFVAVIRHERQIEATLRFQSMSDERRPKVSPARRRCRS